MPTDAYGDESDSPQAWADEAFFNEHPMSVRSMLGRGVKNPKPVTLKIIKAALHRSESVDVAETRN